MIAVTVTHRQGIELVDPITIAIDPEKIVATRDRGSYVEIEYGETYDRRRQPITYQLTTDRASIDALITGSYATHLYLTLTVLWSNDREHRPPLGSADYEIDLQERYIVDIRDTYVNINGTKTAARRIEFVPGSFVPVVIYVSEAFANLITDTPAEVTTTTTTAAPATTTTTESQQQEETTTTTEEVVEETTTTTEEVVEETTTTTEEPVVTTTTTEAVEETTTTTTGE
jgi:hypothetical protein